MRSIMLAVTITVCLAIIAITNRLAIEKLLAPGYSCCNRCERPWKFVEGHATSFNEYHVMFPLCEKCWQELGTPEARLPYYRQLWYEWEMRHPGYVNWDEIERSVMEGE
jgi:hypothetical protein